MLETVAQIIGIFAAAMNILSYQCKSKNRLIFMQLFGSLLFTANYIILGAIMGGIMNALAVLRAIAFLYKDKLRINNVILIGIFVFLFIGSYVLSFTVLGTEPSAKNLIIEALPVIGMCSVTVSFNMKNATAVRFVGITLNSPGWLVYNVCSGSIGAILCEVFSLISLLVGIIRHDIKKLIKPKADSDSTENIN